MAPPMECRSIPSAQLPHTSRLFSTYHDDFPRLSDFYPHPPTEAGVLGAIRQLSHGPAPEPALRRSVVEILREQNLRFGSGDATRKNLERLTAGSVAIVTGQQVGLFSGPAYSFYKALSIIRLAADLTSRGHDAVPIFWLATEDHDLAEVNHCWWLSRSDLSRLELAPAGPAGQRVGEVRLGDAVSALVAQAISSLDGPAADLVSEALQDSYRPQETFGTAFAKLFARLFARHGLILLDPLDPRLHRLAAPIYRRALEDHAALAADLLARGRQLDRARYHAQVKVLERSTLLFLNHDGQRLPLRPAAGRGNSGFVAGKYSHSLADLLALLDHDPARFSPNVLLRPVVQDTLLPTAAYIAGPAEVAYFAQAEVVYRRLLPRMPAILPRAGFTLVEPHVARLLKKYSLDLGDLFRGRQHLRSKLERQFLTGALAARFTNGEKSLRSLLAGLRRPLGKLDKTLVGSLSTAEKKILYQFLRLREKTGRAQGARQGILARHQQQLTDSLYPHHGLQERSLCLLPFLARHGDPLLDALLRHSSLCTPSPHHLLFL